MDCYVCGAALSELDYCTNCGADVGRYKKLCYIANRLYNEGLDRARIRDLSGAIRVLKECLKCNKNHTDARNLLGLIYYEMGEAGSALIQWIVSMNYHSERNVAEEYLNMIPADKGRQETINTTLKKYNVALEYCQQNNNDLAIIQLKKVLSLNPGFAKAHRLLGLLYMENQDWEHAKRELERCRKIDVGDVDAMLYLQECQERLYGDERGQGRRHRHREEPAAVYTRTGSDVLIQPVAGKEPLGLHVFLEIALGILVGVLATWFLIIPGREAQVRNEESAKTQEYTKQIEQKNSEITDLNTRIRELEGNVAKQSDVIDGYSGEDGAMAANENLHAAALSYLGDSGEMDVDQYLSRIADDYVEQSAPPKFKELYQYLMDHIGGKVGESYYNNGMDAFHQQDYVNAIAYLKKACEYDPNNDDALYYLGVCCYESGDVNQAADIFNDLLTRFPDSAQADKARQRLEAIGE